MENTFQCVAVQMSSENVGVKLQVFVSPGYNKNMCGLGMCF